MARALWSSSASVMLMPKQFQLFQPSGGAGAMCSLPMSSDAEVLCALGLHRQSPRFPESCSGRQERLFHHHRARALILGVHHTAFTADTAFATAGCVHITG